MSASISKEYISKRGHKVPEGFPFIIDSSFEKIKKTKEVQTAFINLGLKADLERVNKKKVRAGKGKARGRKYKRRVGPLVVISEDCNLKKSARNLMGVEVVEINKINAKLLAPGMVPGRLTLYTKKAIEKAKEENLFM